MQVNKNRFRQLAIIFALFFYTTSCVEEYWPALNANSNQLLVIDGKITNFPGPYTIKLSTSSSIDEAVFTHLSLAKVTIIDNQGNQELLTEKTPGIYKTSPVGMQGIVGRSYKIKIQLNNGKIYESAFEELKTPVEVENVIAEESIKLAVNELESDQEGFQFYVSSKPAETSPTYLYWEIEETYEYRSDYNIVFLYNGKTYETTQYNQFGLAETRNQDTLRFCWKTQNVGERFSYSTEYLSVPVVNKLPLHFIPYNDERLHYKYSILVKQYTISEEAYTFLHRLEQENNNQEALFTTQPYQIRGNVFNLEDSSEPVLGYFIVASGINGPRVLAKAPSRIRWSYTRCSADTAVSTIQYNINLASSTNQIVYFTFVLFENPNPDIADNGVLAYMSQECLDCTRLGGVAIKPEYWDW